MAIYTKAVLDEIRSKIDLVDYLEKRGVALHPSGTTWKGLCPVHSERTPSFHVNRSLQTFRCFGCGVSGDIFNLMRELDNLSFPGSVRQASDVAGVVLADIEPDPDYEKRKRLLDACLLASHWFRHCYKQLPSSHPAKQNLIVRDLYELSVQDDTIGYAPPSGTMGMMLEKGFLLDELIDAGLVKLNKEEQPVEVFRNRLMWTVTDVQGKPVGFSGRRLNESDYGKYVNSPQTLLYNKSKTLLGLSQARRAILQQQQVYVVEGATDVMAMRAAGLVNTVASCGTAFGTEHGDMLLHLAKQGKNASSFTVTFCFDGDEAGVKAARAVFERCPSLHQHAEVVRLLDAGEASDPSDFYKAHGTQLSSYVEQSRQPLIEFVLQEELNNSDTTTPEGLLSFLNRIRPIIQQVQNQIQRQAYLRKVASWTGASVTQLLSMLDRPAQPAQETRQQEGTEKPKYAADPWEDKMLAAIIQFPEETIATLQEKGVKLSFFPHRPELARELLTQATVGESYDMSNPTVAWLSHLRLGATPGREKETVEHLLQGFMKHRYLEEVRLLGQLPATEEGFLERIRRQEELRNKYGQPL